MVAQQTCSHCDGRGYVEIRDCTGDIQREETCMLCGGTGQREIQANNFTNLSDDSQEKKERTSH